MRPTPLLIIALLLVAVWLFAVIAMKVLHFAVHLALVAAVVMLAVWAMRRLRFSSGGRG